VRHLLDAEIEDKMGESDYPADLPYFLICRPQYILGTSKGIGKSEATREYYLDEFARDANIQLRLKLHTVALVAPAVFRGESEEPIQIAVAEYLAKFAAPDQRATTMKYLVGTGLIRLLIIDEKLRKQIEEDERTAKIRKGAK
jgi:hypothetical protein